MLNPISAERPRLTLRHRTRFALVAVAISALAATAAGCTSSPAKSSTRTTVDAAAKCTTWASVVSAFTALDDAHVSSSDKAAAIRNIHAIQKADKNFRPTVTKDVKEKIKGLQASIKTLATAVRKQSGTSAVPAAVAQVNASWNALVTSVGSSCPTVTASTVAP
jgi:hypothetical protein